MTLEQRLAIIENKAIKDKAEASEKKKSLQIKTEEALQKVQGLALRIKAIITLGNKCIEQGIEFPSSSETTKFGYGRGYNTWNFCADGFYHHVGFMDIKYRNSGMIQYLGIDEGGFCGVWDFYTNGTETFLKHENDGTIKEAELHHLNEFLDEFEVFEKAFYRWIDNLTEEKAKK